MARLLFLVLLLVAGDALAQARKPPAKQAQAKPCAQEEAMAAEKAAGRPAPTWEALHESFTRYGHCDDGAIAAGFSDSVARLLGSRWEQFGSLQKLAASDRAFRAFVLRHIDASAYEKDIERLIANAASRCADDARQLCHEIRRAGEAAAREQGREQSRKSR